MKFIPESVILRSLIDTFIPTGIFFVVHDNLFKAIMLKKCSATRSSVVFGFDLINTMTLIVVSVRLAFIVVVDDIFNLTLQIPFFEEYLAVPVDYILSSIPGYCKTCIEELDYINIGNTLLVVCCFWQIVVQSILYKFLAACSGFINLIKLNLTTIYAYIISATVLVLLHIIVALIFPN